MGRAGSEARDPPDARTLGPGAQGTEEHESPFGGFDSP